MARILITGHDGFTGQFLWQSLQRAGHDVLNLDRGPGPVDLRNSESVFNALEGLKPDKIVHLAGVSSVTHPDVKQIYEVNLLGTRNLLEAILRHLPNLDRVIIASSANVYGNQHGQLAEHSAIKPVNDYAVSKASVELLTQAYQPKIPIVITRPFNYTGAGQSENFVIPKIIQHLKSGNLDIRLGNIDVARDFSDVRDVVSYYQSLLDHPDAVGQTFNLCSGKSIKLRDVITIAEQLSGRQLRLTHDQDLMRPNEISDLYGDPSKLEKLIGKIARISLRDTLEWMLST